MTLEDLRAFVTAFQAESLSEAARQLGCTQGAVAQHVRRLERELGTELFTRVPRGVVPTDLGRIFYEGASGALGHLEMAIREIERCLDERQGRLRLAVSAMAAAELLRPSILALKKKRPGVLIEIVPENTAEGRLRALREGRADLALVPLAEEIRGLETRPVMELELVLLVHDEHRLAARKRVRLEELGRLRYIAQGPSSATFCHVQRALAEAGVTLEVSQIVEEPRTAILMVELGRGETFVPAAQASNMEHAGPVRGVSVPSLPSLRVGWASQSFSLLSDVAAEFIREFDEFVRRVQ